ncbi:hypothetical protein ABH931_002628 [Streptacidiphilus sp. MAP12-33]|uniref:hypothetical protein n=1 Tax=Streptacidiphilus sp. MAP12-33 TaxID=3156266 RepID=UPI003517DE71
MNSPPSPHAATESVHRRTGGAVVTVGGHAHQVDFAGDTVMAFDAELLRRYRAGSVEAVPLLVTADACDGAGATIGEVTWVLDPDRLPPAGALRALTPGQPFPAVQEFALNIRVTIPDLLPGVTLRNRVVDGPVILRNANAIAFPPENDAYELAVAVRLEDVARPGPVLATIDSFPTVANPVRPVVG